MAHKIQTERFRRLRELLDASGRSYAVYVSAANHETSSLEDAEARLPARCTRSSRAFYFLGNLSDVAVYNELRRATYFAAFFPTGARANNTSVAAAMETRRRRDHEPRPLLAAGVRAHGERDRHRAVRGAADRPRRARRLRARARETATARGWDALVDHL